MKFSSCLATLTAALAVSTIAAHASDKGAIFADDANFNKSATIGSGWYLRGDIGANFNASHDILTTGSATQSVLDDNNFTDGYNYSIGAGYRINNFLRLESSLGRTLGSDYSSSQLVYLSGEQPAGTDPSLVINANDPIACNGWGTFVDASGNEFVADDFITNCVRSESSEYDTVTAMATAYVDLPSVGGFQPFVGAGFGVARTSWREEIGRYDCTPQAESARAEGCRAYGTPDQPEANTPYTQQGDINSDVDYRLGYSINAGFAYHINEQVALDTTYKYMKFGDAGVPQDGSGIASNGFAIHQVNVGLRYSLF